MSKLVPARRLLRSLFGALLMAASMTSAQTQQPLPLKPAIPGTTVNHRIILKDGSYQIVRKYQVVGDRLRYQSVERGDDWEEIPVALVDWEATRKWERDHIQSTSEEPSPAMEEAAKIDKEEAAERDEQNSLMPEVAKGLELPNEDSVFALDTFQGTPELVELLPNTLGIDAKTHHGLSTFNPMAGARASIELPGAHAKVHLHVNDPSIYLALDSSDSTEHVLSHALTVDTSSSKIADHRKHGANSPNSGFAIVRVDERKAVRVIGALHLGRNGEVTQNEDLIPAKAELMPGKHWLKLTPVQPLLIGEYALVEILSPSDISETVWDFRVDPQLGDNPGSLGPILKR